MQEDAEPGGTALGDCVGWSMVFSILPGDSSWEDARPDPGSIIASVWAVKGLGVDLTPCPLLAFTYPEELSRPFCRFYHHMHPTGVRH